MTLIFNKKLFFTYIVTRMKSKIFLVFACLHVAFLGQAQKDLYIKGVKHFEAKNYEVAATYFYADKYGNANKELLLRRMVCNYYLGELDESKKDISTLLGFDVIPDETYLYIGKIFHEEGKYKKAIENYKIYLKRLSPKSDQRAEIIHVIKQCGMATRLKYKEPYAFVDNYGPEINSKFDDFRMIQSPNYNTKYYFSSARENATGGKRDSKGKVDQEFGSYNSDMYSVEMVNGRWMEAQKLNEYINSSRDEMALDFSADGSILFYVKGADYEQGTIFSDTFVVDKKSVLNPPKLESPIKAESGDVCLHLFNDSTMLFASNRAGGYGGYDIYVTAKRNGKWSKPKNLGPKINSKYDESYPHITNDGKTLFFSSNRVNSLGAYDVFFSEYDLQMDAWKEAENMGAPINSASNDIAFYVSKDGFTASLTSDRKQGFGGYDIYVAYFKNQLKNQMFSSDELAFIANDEFESEQVIAMNTSKEKTSSQVGSKSKIKRPKSKRSKKNTKNKGKADKIAKNNKQRETEVAQPIAEPTEPTGLVRETKKEYVINTIYYVPDKEIITAVNRRELDILADLLIVYPSLELEIKAHTKEEGLEAYDLYFSIKRAEKIADYLIKKGVKPENIGLKGYGSNYPIAKEETGGVKSKIGEKVNSRIEFFILNAENLPVEITIVEPYLVEYLRDPKGELFKTVEDGLSYRVQIASVKQMYQNQVLLLYNDSMIEKDYGDINYKYTLGLYEKYDDAKLLVKDLANYNISGAFIVPYIDGQKIPQNKMTDYAKYYPDLLKFMQYNDE